MLRYVFEVEPVHVWFHTFSCDRGVFLGDLGAEPAAGEEVGDPGSSAAAHEGVVNEVTFFGPNGDVVGGELFGKTAGNCTVYTDVCQILIASSG